MEKIACDLLVLRGAGLRTTWGSSRVGHERGGVGNCGQEPLSRFSREEWERQGEQAEDQAAWLIPALRHCGCP